MQLERPAERFFRSFQQSMLEWEGAHQDGAGIRDAAPLAMEAGFAEWVMQLLAEEFVSAGEGFVTCSYYWMVEGDEYLGSIALRHELNDFLRCYGGHIGYSVRPSARRRGIASQALQGALRIAHHRGLSEVLLTCDPQNLGSRLVIEGNGGRLECEAIDGAGQVFQRFWISTEAGRAEPHR
ncbi:putative acetyltransferase [Curtobacterium sp. PhB42]|uniref:GNAT family N-acetyltransferase n=1 Tax=unclassified Curtobacterium TaxID=257496 RepID=UPI0010645E4F|nr:MULTISPECIES: GNAT family N-acetyltransferase [unclassified Curtobacterium]TDW39685.1 putative acetyltransferase [Curtobacterium sp. PhB42]TDW50792.1 putative acetyltransferase [Curtobacterium sp. PhB190]